MEDEGSAQHVIERAALHFGVSILTYIGAYYGAGWIARLWPGLTVKLLAAVIVFAVIATREIHDVNRGQPVLKAVTDLVSWIAGLTFSIWVLHAVFGV